MGTVTLGIDGSVFTDEWTTGDYIRVCRIDGLVQTGEFELLDEIFNGTHTPPLPGIGDALPAPFNGMVCVRRAAPIIQNDGRGNRWAQVTLTYRLASVTVVGQVPDDDGAGVTTTGASVVPDRRYQDASNNDITTTFNGRDQLHWVDYLRPQSTPEFTRREVSSPRGRADTYVGKLNSGSWNGYSDRTVLCTSISGYSQDGGLSYITTYRFEFRPNWDAVAIHESPLYPGFPVDNPTGSELRTVQVYDDISFAPLNISL